MAINDRNEARVLAEQLAEELIAGLDSDMLEEARTMGLSVSMFSVEIEEYRAKFNSVVSDEIAEEEFFDVIIAKFLS
jgi:trans-aconitate methyltransferase